MNKFKETENFLKVNYSHLKKIHNIQLLDHNNINSINYLISTKTSKFVLHKITDGSQSEKINSMCNILNYCSKNNAKVPKPITNNQNTYSKNSIYLTKYYEGNLFSGTKQEFKETAKEFAILHKTLSHNSIPYNFRIFQNSYKILQNDEIKLILKIIKNKKSTTPFDRLFLNNKDFIVKIIFEHKKLENENKSFERNSKQLIHNDLHPKNIIYHNRRVSVILDFGSMRKGNILEDIAFTSYRFSTHNTKKISDIKNNIVFFINEYLNHNELSIINSKRLEYFFIKKILNRLSFILKMNYFSNSFIWNSDFIKHIRFLQHGHNSKIFTK